MLLIASGAYSLLAKLAYMHVCVYDQVRSHVCLT